MNNRGNLNLGDEIRFIVQDALNNRDFNRLNRDIGNVVNGALDEVRRSVERKRENHQHWNNTWNNNTWNHNTRNDTAWKNPSWNSNEYQQNHNKNSQTWNSNSNQYSQENNSQKNVNQNYRYNYPNTAARKPMKCTVPVGQVSGTLLTVFGTIGSSASVIASIILAVIGYLVGSSALYHIIVLGLVPCFVACLILSLNGSRIRKRLKRFQRYISQMNGRNYCLIKDFSSVTGRSNNYTVKDLQNMIAIGMFPEGHIDEKKTCFMLNRESYEQYLNLQENMRKRDMEEQDKNSGQTKSQEKKTSQDQMQEDNKKKKDTLDPIIRKAVDEGRQYVQKIRNANIAIPGEEISRKLDRLEEVTGKIYDYVEIHPEKFPEIKKFTEYFLPTTLKILDAYREFEYQPVEGENISSAKKEIEDTMDTINFAFENLLDGLFEEVAMDISTDISVLETMFAQEGLT
ncbi:MAG: 5-bromo-4-chloroindolyl phosphate hydrolysis family protein [Herbinix sp.]|nr:5-bromo-4-chloroindolyl phosphate hydrolysis family protein [Herbinix sp.]